MNTAIPTTVLFLTLLWGASLRLAPANNNSTHLGKPLDKQLATGRSLFLNSCASCHGKEAQGINGPSLYSLGLTDDQARKAIENGFPEDMPAFMSRFKPEQIEALVRYVQSLKR